MGFPRGNVPWAGFGAEPQYKSVGDTDKSLFVLAPHTKNSFPLVREAVFLWALSCRCAGDCIRSVIQENILRIAAGQRIAAVYHTTVP